MFQFAGNIIKNDAKNTDLFPHRVFLVEGRGWLYTGYCQKQLKTLFCCLLLMHLRLQELLAFLWPHLFGQLKFSMVFLIS